MTSPLLTFDAELCQVYGLELIGVDEVGRGSWVGPVVAAAVHLPGVLLQAAPTWLDELNDSKQLKADKREHLARELHGHARIGLGEASIDEIEQLNLHHASLLAARRAVESLLADRSISLLCRTNKALLLIDGRFTIPQLDLPQQAVVRGDGQSASIAAASIVAKVYRDTLLTHWHATWPVYHWHRNKGYGTVFHRRAIAEHGACELHRPRFLASLNC